MGTVYLITNTRNLKCYVGATQQTSKQRWNSHCHRAKRGGTSKLYVDIRKYGIGAFTLEDLATDVPEAELELMEHIWMCLMGACAPKGYNIMKAYYKQPLSLRTKIGLAVRNKWSDSDFKAKMRRINQNPTHRNRMREVQSMPAVKSRQSNGMKAHWKDPAWRGRMVAVLQKQHRDPEYRKRISDTVKRLYQDPLYRKHRGLPEV